MKTKRLSKGEYQIKYRGREFKVHRYGMLLNRQYAPISWHVVEYSIEDSLIGKIKVFENWGTNYPTLKAAKAAIKNQLDEEMALSLLGDPTPVIVGYPTNQPYA